MRISVSTGDLDPVEVHPIAPRSSDVGVQEAGGDVDARQGTRRCEPLRVGHLRCCETLASLCTHPASATTASMAAADRGGLQPGC